MVNVQFSLAEVRKIVEATHSSELLSATQVAERLHVSVEEVQAWAEKGILPGQKVGEVFVFRLSALTEWELSGVCRWMERQSLEDQAAMAAATAPVAQDRAAGTEPGGRRARRRCGVPRNRAADGASVLG